MRLMFVLAVASLLSSLPALGHATATGTGFVVARDGYILTNQHVIADASSVTVYVQDRAYPAEIITQTEELDLALLRIDARGLIATSLGDSTSVEPLDEVVAIGYPLSEFGRDLTASSGEITSIRTNVTGREAQETFQHSAVIYSGSSGGPLFNLHGEVIGINYAGIEGSELKFAIPISDALPLLRQVPGFDARTMGQATEILTPRQVLEAYRSAVVLIECESVVDLSSLIPSSIPGYVHQHSSPLDVTNLEKSGFDVIAAAAVQAGEHDQTGAVVKIGPFARATAAVVVFGREEDAVRATGDALFQLTGDSEIEWKTDLGDCWTLGELKLTDTLAAQYRLRIAAGYIPRDGAANSGVSGLPDLYLSGLNSSRTWTKCWSALDGGSTVLREASVVPITSVCDCSPSSYPVSLLKFDYASYAGMEGVVSIRFGTVCLQVAFQFFLCNYEGGLSNSGDRDCYWDVDQGMLIASCSGDPFWRVGLGDPPGMRPLVAVADLIAEFERVMKYVIAYTLEQLQQAADAH